MLCLQAVQELPDFEVAALYHNITSVMPPATLLKERGSCITIRVKLIPHVVAEVRAMPKGEVSINIIYNRGRVVRVSGAPDPTDVTLRNIGVDWCLLSCCRISVRWNQEYSTPRRRLLLAWVTWDRFVELLLGHCIYSNYPGNIVLAVSCQLPIKKWVTIYTTISANRWIIWDRI